MFETGWSEATLAAASERTIAKMRHALYARAHAKTLGLDLNHELRELHEADLTGAAAESARKSAIRRRRSALLSLRPIQAALRKLLFLDDPTPVPEGEE